MFSLKDLHLKHKLVAMQLLTAGGVLLLFGALTLLNELRTTRSSLVTQLASTAELIGSNSMSALDFNDKDAAASVLASLQAAPDVASACISDRENRIFARYSRPGSPDLAAPPRMEDYHEFSGGGLTTTRRIKSRGETLGTIRLYSDMAAYHRSITRGITAALAVLALGLLAAFLLAMRTQRAISEPVLNLVEAAKKVTETGNYSVRVARQGSDEIGQLGDAFNEMISQVQRRETSLQEAHKALEDRVSERTAELRAANDQLSAIFDAATSGILMIKDRAVLRCNRKIYELFGYAPGELIGRKTRDGYTDDSAFKAIGAESAACLARGEIFFREDELVRKDGSRFWARITAQAVERTDPASGMVALVSDITEEHRQTEALKTALEAAESADKLKSAFLATMSHELRTPLNSIIGFSGIMLQELAGPLNDEQKKQLGMVSGSAEHLLDLINDVLDISKIEAGQLHVLSEPFDLCEAVHKAVLTAKPLADKKHITLDAQVAPEACTINADRRRVEQVLLNLLSNSIKFTEKGGVRVECGPRDGRMLIRVVDSGIGMRKEDLEKLFKPFQQIDTGLSRQYEGTGLGLSICKRLTELMGGTIGVESEPGKGSTFSVTLPEEKKTV